ncbi:MAG: enoyl-CoA hydratase [Fuerstiella sp.]|nr:enoyl-CoA hydratase [Fuerstiella sp.]
MSFDTIDYSVDRHVATIALNRPDRLNAITKQLESELLEAMRLADVSSDVRVIVLTGNGRGFCAGADLELLQSVTETNWATANIDKTRREFMPERPHDSTPVDFQKTWSYFPAISKPIIGAINGAAVGLGFVLQLYCDIRFASDNARFGTAFAQRGLIAEHGISWLLPRITGLSHALDLLYSARIIDANEALNIGLVSRVIPHDNLMETTHQYAQMLATTVSPRSLKVMKKQIYQALFTDLGDAIETANEEMILSFQCDDFREGVAHFVEKRAPHFTGQ